MTSQDLAVYIVDDEAAVRDSLALLLKQEGINVQTFENAEAFLNAYQPDYKGCIILDVNMPGIGGMQLQEKLMHHKCMMPIIFLTGYGNIPMSVRAIKAGAIDFLTKPITRSKLLASIQSAFLESEKLLEASKHNHDALSRLKSLSKREQEVMALAIQGYHNKKIAIRLGISFRTVEIHRSNIMHKTGAINLLDLARIAYESGLVS